MAETAENPVFEVDSSPTSVAQRVAAYAGDPYQLQALDFTFVAIKGGEQKARRTHQWHPADGDLSVSDGVIDVHFVGLLHAPDLAAHCAEPEASRSTWATYAPGSSPTDAARAWGWFTNDSYWLLAPSKVTDPGVTAIPQLDGSLTLQFGDVGLTPGDRYQLWADDDGRVTRWSFLLQSGRKGAFAFEDYTKVGPLQLSLRRVSPGVVIRFEEVSAR